MSFNLDALARKQINRRRGPYFPQMADENAAGRRFHYPTKPHKLYMNFHFDAFDNFDRVLYNIIAASTW